MALFSFYLFFGIRFRSHSHSLPFPPTAQSPTERTMNWVFQNKKSLKIENQREMNVQNRIVFNSMISHLCKCVNIVMDSIAILD